MAQVPKSIDLRQSYQPVNPETWSPQAYVSDRADSPDMLEGVAPYDGKNFLPTSYGYKSYFGLERAFLETLPLKCQELVFLQLDTLENIAVALCEDGIWIKRANEQWKLQARDLGGADVLVEGIEFDLDEFLAGNIELPNILQEGGTEYNFLWSYTIIENIFYAYRQGSSKVWTINTKDTLNSIDEYSYESISITEHLDTTDGTLPVGTYDIAIAFTRYEDSPTGSGLIAKRSLLKDIGSFILTTANAGFQILIEDIHPLPVELIIYYRVDAGAWHQKTLYPPNFYTINGVWKDPGTELETYPPEADVVPAGTPVARYPNFINMVGQLGIFRAGARLAFWDSANAIAIASVVDQFDFEPSVQTLAGVITYSQVKGRIVTIVPEEDNFVIYATRSIVRAVKNITSVGEWEAESVSQVAGISYPGCVTQGSTEAEHYVYSSIGLLYISEGKQQVIWPEIYEALKKANEDDKVVYLKCIGGRYLFIESFQGVFKPLRFDQRTVSLLGLSNQQSWCTNILEGVYRARIDGTQVNQKNELAFLRSFMNGAYTVGDALYPYPEDSWAPLPSPYKGARFFPCSVQQSTEFGIIPPEEE